jgi:hypothetical protein
MAVGVLSAYWQNATFAQSSKKKARFRNEAGPFFDVRKNYRPIESANKRASVG